MTNNYDIFISYKRKSLPTANNLYYRLTTRGYSTFFDLEEMGRDNFNVQLLNYIENAKDVFVILEEGSLDGCRHENWEKEDWFCHEIAFALEKKKNIIPILIGGYIMPSEDYFPDKLKELGLKNAPEFNFSFFEAYLDKLVEKKYLLSKPNSLEKATSVFKFYSNENCQVFKEGKLVCSLEGMSDEPFYLPVPRKGDYRFKAVNIINAGKQQILKEHIDADEEKDVDIEWESRIPLKPDVFLSYSRKDYNIVRKIKQEIEQATKATCWMDLDGISNKSPDFTKIIAPAIEQASIFVFVLTPNSQISRFARNELLLAKVRNKHIFFVEPRECEMTSEFFLEYGHHNRNLYYIDYQRQKLYEELSKLLDHSNVNKDVPKVQTIEERELVRFVQNGKFGFIDNHSGEIVIDCKWAYAEGFQEGLAFVKDEFGKHGFIDKTGTLVISCQWNKASNFSEGLAAVMGDNSKFGFIDKNGNVAITCDWKDAWSFTEGLARVKDERGKYGFIDKTGTPVIPCTWIYAKGFHGGLAFVKGVEEEGYIDKNGKVVISY